MKVSSFQSATRPALFVESAPKDSQYLHYAFKNVEFETIIKAVTSGAWGEKIRHAKAKKGGWDVNKKSLPCFTPSGTFRIRCDWDILEYSQIVVLDYDKCSEVLLIANETAARILRSRLAGSPYCFAAFVSPGGDGVKVFVRVNSGVDLHATAWSQVRESLDTAAGMKSDPTGRNLSRLCFVSADPYCYFNPDAKIFEVSEVKPSVTIPDLSILADAKTVFGYLYNLTMKGKYQGEVLGEYGARRNNFLYVFSCNCNRYGIDQPQAFEFVKAIWVQNNMGFTQQELSKTVSSAYQHRNEFNTYRLPKSLPQGA
jgi:hypothetical protein